MTPDLFFDPATLALGDLIMVYVGAVLALAVTGAITICFHRLVTALAYGAIVKFLWKDFCDDATSMIHGTATGSYEGVVTMGLFGIKTYHRRPDGRYVKTRVPYKAVFDNPTAYLPTRGDKQ